jgi:hypothetical protein
MELVYDYNICTFDFAISIHERRLKKLLNFCFNIITTESHTFFEQLVGQLFFLLQEGCEIYLQICIQKLIFYENRNLANVLHG